MSVVPAQEESLQTSRDSESVLPPTTTLGHSPISSIIRPQLWIHWTITIVCFAAWGGMLYLGELTERTDAGLRDIVGLRSGRLTNFFSTMMLLWAGQLSLLIYWYRRKSRNDFAGRYRMWLWICGLLQMFLIVVATGAHHPFSEYMQRLWPLDMPGYGVLSWLVPISTLGLALYRLLRIELRRHRSGKLLLNIAFGAGLIAAVSVICGALLPQRIRDIIQIGSATLCHLGLATALLMHARYVVHISNEAPRRERTRRRLLSATREMFGHLPRPQGIAIRKRLATLSIPTLAMPRFSVPKVSFRMGLRFARGTKAEHDRQQQTSAKQPGAKGQGISPVTETSSSSEVSAVRSQDAPKSTVSPRTKKRKSPRSADRHRLDEAQPVPEPKSPTTRSFDDILNEFGEDSGPEQEAMQGMSKKERRRFRKKQRELQRSR